MKRALKTLRYGILKSAIDRTEVKQRTLHYAFLTYSSAYHKTFIYISASLTEPQTKREFTFKNKAFMF